VKFSLDEDLSPKIAEIARKVSMDCTSAHEVNMLQASDYDQLVYAVAEKRCHATKNRDDFITLSVMFFNDQDPRRTWMFLIKGLIRRRRIRRFVFPLFWVGRYVTYCNRDGNHDPNDTDNQQFFPGSQSHDGKKRNEDEGDEPEKYGPRFPVGRIDRVSGPAGAF
jgi:hypothetical protein